MDDVQATSDSNEQVLIPDIPLEPAPPIQSRFLFVDVAALRAKQLRRGARVRFNTEANAAAGKLERVAMEEVRRGLVHYTMPQPATPVAPSGEDQ
jgi:DNA-directed RNA polymerase subunit K/omega